MPGSTQHKVADTFGAIAIVPHDRFALSIDIVGRNYDTAGHLHVGHAHIRLPLAAAIKLHALLADAITAADGMDDRQPGLWSNTTHRVSA